jgi:hypothetical protein
MNCRWCYNLIAKSSAKVNLIGEQGTRRKKGGAEWGRARVAEPRGRGGLCGNAAGVLKF